MSVARDLLDVARRINGPTLIVPGAEEPEEALASFEAVVERIRVLAGGQPVEIAPGFANWPDLDGFHCVRIRQGGTVLATYGDRWTIAERDQRLASLRSVFA